MTTGQCGGPDHEGDRLTYLADLFDKRIEYRRHGKADRYKTVTVAYLCRVCVNREVEQYRSEGPPTERLF